MIREKVETASNLLMKYEKKTVENVVFTAPKIKVELLLPVIGKAKQVYDQNGSEFMSSMHCDDVRWSFECPDQWVSPASAKAYYKLHPERYANYKGVIHRHPGWSRNAEGNPVKATHSSVDEADEKKEQVISIVFHGDTLLDVVETMTIVVTSKKGRHELSVEEVFDLSGLEKFKDGPYDYPPEWDDRVSFDSFPYEPKAIATSSGSWGDGWDDYYYQGSTPRSRFTGNWDLQLLKDFRDWEEYVDKISGEELEDAMFLVCRCCDRKFVYLQCPCCRKPVMAEDIVDGVRNLRVLSADAREAIEEMEEEEKADDDRKEVEVLSKYGGIHDFDPRPIVDDELCSPECPYVDTPHRHPKRVERR